MLIRSSLVRKWRNHSVQLNHFAYRLCEALGPDNGMVTDEHDNFNEPLQKIIDLACDKLVEYQALIVSLERENKLLRDRRNMKLSEPARRNKDAIDLDITKWIG